MKEGRVNWGNVRGEHEGKENNKCLVLQAKQKLASQPAPLCVSSRLTATRHYTPKFLKTFEDRFLLSSLETVIVDVVVPLLLCSKGRV